MKGSRSILVLTLVLSCLSMLAGCARPSQEIIEEASNSSKDFLLGPEDVLDIVVWKNEDLSQKGAVIRPDGHTVAVYGPTTAP